MTEKMALFAKLYYTPGLSTFGNGIQSYRQAYPNCKSDKAASVQAARLLVNACVIAERVRYQAELSEKIEHNYEIAVKMLKDRLEYLQDKAVDGDIQAANAQVSIIKELNDIAGLHKQHIVNETEDVQDLSNADIALLRELAMGLTEKEIGRPTIHKLHESA